jgi:hypothetical protein
MPCGISNAGCTPGCSADTGSGSIEQLQVYLLPAPISGETVSSMIFVKPDTVE